MTPAEPFTPEELLALLAAARVVLSLEVDFEQPGEGREWRERCEFLRSAVRKLQGDAPHPRKATPLP